MLLCESLFWPLHKKTLNLQQKYILYLTFIKKNGKIHEHAQIVTQVHEVLCTDVDAISLHLCASVKTTHTFDKNYIQNNI